MPTFARTLLPALLLLAACPKSNQTTDPQPVAPDGRPASPSADPQAPTAIAPVDNAHQLLPPDIQLLFEGKSLARAAKVFQARKVEKEAPEAYGFLKQGAEQLFGVDIFVPANLPSIGVDPDGPVGVGMLDVKQEAFVVYCKLTDPGRFRQVVMDSAGRNGVELTPTSMGGAEVLKARKGRVAVVLREPFAVLVGSDRKGEVDYARVIATMDPSQSLAHTRAFKKATAGWVDPDALMFANLAGFVDGVMADAGAQPEFGNWAHNELEEARKRGAPADEIKRLEDQAKEIDKENKRWAKRREAQQDLARFMFGNLETIAARIDVKRHGPILEGRVQLQEDQFPRTLLRNGNGSPPLTKALNGRPLMLMTGTVEVDAFVDLVDRIARTEGESFKKLSKDLKKETGVDLEAEIRGLVTGVAGGAVTLDVDPRKLKARELRKNIGFAVHAKVNDPDMAKRLIGEGLPKLDFDGQKFKKDGDGWSLAVKDYRKVWVKVAGKHVVVSTDPSLAGRIKDGSPGSISKQIQPAGAFSVMSMKGQAFSYVQDFALFGSFFFLGTGFDFPSDVENRKPKSREAKKKLAELKRLNAQIAKQREVVEGKELTRMMDALDPFGTTVLVATEEKDGFVVTGGQFIRAEGLGDLIIHAAKLFQSFGMQNEPERQKLNELMNRRFQLEDEIRQMTDQDAARLKRAGKGR